MVSAGTVAERSYLRFGAWIAVATFVIDQLNKIYLVEIYDLPSKGQVTVAPFLDLIMVWNRGVSYGLFASDSPAQQWALAGFATLVSLGLIYWLTKIATRPGAIGLGLLIGGALGNALDRVRYGAVADFYALHAFGYSWYVFNIADAAIVAGVAFLLYDTLFDGPKKTLSGL